MDNPLLKLVKTDEWMNGYKEGYQDGSLDEQITILTLKADIDKLKKKQTGIYNKGFKAGEDYKSRIILKTPIAIKVKKTGDLLTKRFKDFGEAEKWADWNYMDKWKHQFAIINLSN